MKRLLAIVFSAALVWAQSAPVVCAQLAPAAAGQTACSCCHCGKAKCCLCKTAPRSQPLPAAPAPRAGQSLQFLLLAPATLAYALPQSATGALSSPASSLRRAAALPLYRQNCALLI